MPARTLNRMLERHDVVQRPADRPGCETWVKVRIVDERANRLQARHEIGDSNDGRECESIEIRPQMELVQLGQPGLAP